MSSTEKIKISAEQLGWFFNGGIQTEILSRVGEFENVDFGVKKINDSVIEVAVSFKNQIKNAWRVNVDMSERKIMKTAIEIVDEIENSYTVWANEEDFIEMLEEQKDMSQAHFSADLAGIGNY